MVVVLVAASGAGWEPDAVRLLDAQPGIVVLKRCVDVDDLLAAAATEQADAAVLGLDAPGLDPAATARLLHHGVRPVVVVPSEVAPEAATARASRLGVRRLVPEAELDRLPAALTTTIDDELREPVPDMMPSGASSDATAARGGDAGRVVVVWGPSGAPGRTTLATALAAELAARDRAAVLVDADPYAASVAQHLGILDEVSGLLAAARLAGAGHLTGRLAGVLREVDTHLAVLTGLPRPDRWVEVRPGALTEVLDTARSWGTVLVDTGSGLEDDTGGEPGLRPGRNQLTLEALAAADDVVAVGTADPVGLARLARGLADLRAVIGNRPVHVVVNRMRSTLGWSEREVATMVWGFCRVAGLHFLPEDRAATDRALATGRALTQVGASSLRQAVADVVDRIPSLSGNAGEHAGVGVDDGGDRLLSPRQAAKSR